MPVLLLIGSKEVVTKVEEVKERAEKLIRNLTFRIIDGASHTLSLDKPEIVNPLILEFLDKNYAK
jgi:pimeloyl-ACP methyl ester carboxylesterase